MFVYVQSQDCVQTPDYYKVHTLNGQPDPKCIGLESQTAPLRVVTQWAYTACVAIWKALFH